LTTPQQKRAVNLIEMKKRGFVVKVYALKNGGEYANAEVPQEKNTFHAQTGFREGIKT